MREDKLFRALRRSEMHNYDTQERKALREAYEGETETYRDLQNTADAEFQQIFSEWGIEAQLAELSNTYNKYGKHLACTTRIIPFSRKTEPQDPHVAVPDKGPLPKEVPGLPYMQALQGFAFRITPEDQSDGLLKNWPYNYRVRYDLAYGSTIEAHSHRASDFLVMMWQPYQKAGPEQPTRAPMLYVGPDLSEVISHSKSKQVGKLLLHLGEEELYVSGDHEGVPKVVRVGEEITLPYQEYSCSQKLVLNGKDKNAYTSSASDLTKTATIDRLFQPPSGFWNKHVTHHPPTYFSHSTAFDPSTASVDPNFLSGVAGRIDAFVEQSRFTK